MSIENGEWIMRGIPWRTKGCIHSAQELESVVEEKGFLPLFASDVRGFSAEEWTDPVYWWSDDEKRDPWLWREQIAGRGKVAYGKFFGGKAGFISLEWLPYFANYRRSGYDFDARWEDGLANRREKKIMDFFMTETESGDVLWKMDRILSTELKKEAGFGKEGDKNFPGIMTGLQMQTYLVIAGFRRRKNKKGQEYGMAVSEPLPPEAIWGRELVTRAYDEAPEASWQRIVNRVGELCPDATQEQILKLIGKRDA